MDDIIKNLTKMEIMKVVYQYNKKHIDNYRNKNKEQIKLKRTTETVFCDTCDKNLKKDYFKIHLQQKRHLRLQKLYDEKKEENNKSDRCNGCGKRELSCRCGVEHP